MYSWISRSSRRPAVGPDRNRLVRFVTNCFYCIAEETHQQILDLTGVGLNERQVLPEFQNQLHVVRKRDTPLDVANKIGYIERLNHESRPSAVCDQILGQIGDLVQQFQSSFDEGTGGIVLSQ